MIRPTFVADLLRLPSKRTKRLPAQDRCSLSYKAEAGDPMCYEDADNATTDSGDNDS
jgi:hypothetical protein